MRDQGKAKVLGTTSATSQPVLVGLHASMSCMSRQMPACVGTRGRQEHRQCELGTRQRAQRSARMPRTRRGDRLRAIRSARRRETAWVIAADDTAAGQRSKEGSHG